MEIAYSGFADSTLKAYYKFSTGALTTDSSGNGHTLANITDSTVTEGTGIYGKCAVFDGSTDAYSTANHADFRPSGAFSIALWMKTSDTTTYQRLFQSYSANTNMAGLALSVSSTGASTRFMIGKNTGTTVNTDYKVIEGTANITNNAWHNIVAVYSGTNMYIYVDGKLDNSVASTMNPAYAATSYVRVGCANVDGTDASFYGGSIDDLGFWNGRALSGSDVKYLYQGGAGFLLNMI